MKKKQRILDYIRENIRATAKEIAEALNIPQTSARARISEARKEGYGITKEFGYEIFEEPELRRKIVKTVGYTNGKKQMLYALTYENNDKNRSKFLIKKIINEFISTHGITTKFGYDQEAFVTEAEFEYKDFEVGIE